MTWSLVPELRSSIASRTEPGFSQRPVMTDREFHRVVSRERQRLLALAHRVCPSGIDPEDLVQDTLERAWRARAGFRGDAQPRTWLQRILINRMQNLRRVGGRELARQIDDDTPEFAWLGMTVADPAAIVTAAEDEHQLRSALRTLAPVDRAAVVLSDGEGWTAQDIGLALGLSVEAAHKRIQRGRFRLADALRAATGQLERRAPVSCLGVRQLCSAYLDGVLGDQDRRRVDEHLRSCEYCPPLAQALAGIKQILPQRRGAMSDRLRDRLRTAVALELGRPRLLSDPSDRC